jgi:tRNA(Ile)-lysidine synthase
MDLSVHVQQCLLRHDALQARVAVALSGGIDSMVLLDIVASLSPPMAIEAVHVNHGISPNADAWAGFCREECAKRGVLLTVEVVDVDRNSGAGLEAAARHARYEALKKNSAAFILTAQHIDDQAETVLHQMLRGTGLAGLAGMGEARALREGQTLLRPLLNVSRNDIETYAAAHQLKWIEDESNADTTYTRNFIRHQLTPIVAQRFPHYADSLARIARHAHEASELTEALAKIDLRWNGVDAFADGLDTLDRTRQVNALYHWLRWQKVDPPSHAQLAEWAAQIFRAPPEGKPHQAGGHGFVIRRRKDRLLLNS